MTKAKVFQSENGFAIRIPNEIKITEKEFIIKKYDNCYFLIPADEPHALLRQCLGKMDKNTIFKREQPYLNEIPER